MACSIACPDCGEPIQIRATTGARRNGAIELIIHTEDIERGRAEHIADA